MEIMTLFMRCFYLTLSLLVVFSCEKDDDVTTKDPYQNSQDFPVESIFYGDVVTSSIETMEYLKTFKATKVVGSIRIVDTTNLLNLSTIKEVTNDIRIDRQYSSYSGSSDTVPLDGLLNLQCLSELKIIGGYLKINILNALESLDGLSNLNSVGGDLMIINNKSLKSLTALSNLTSIGGTLTIYSNGELSSLEGFSNLKAIGGSLYIGRTSSYLGNSHIKNLDGLSNLNSVGGSITVFRNDLLENLDGISNVNTIGGGLEILQNESLNDFCGLQNLALTTSFTKYEILYNAYNPNLEALQSSDNCKQ